MPEEISFGKRYARSQHAYLHSNLKERRRSYYKIKTHLNYPDLCQAADYIDKNVYIKYRDLIFGNSLPKNYDELGTGPASIASKNFIEEINWTLLSIRKFTYEINLYLIYKEDYEKNILIGNYTEAEKCLTKIETEICFSLWTLENRFLLKELENKSSENKDFLNNFNSTNKSENYTKSLANYLSIRAEKTLSVNRFHLDLQFSISKMTDYKKLEHTNFYLFNLSFLNSLEYQCFSEIISYNFEHSIIDRYLNLRKLLAILLTTSNNFDNDKDRHQISEYILNRINYLLRKINDPIISKLKLFASTKLFPAFNEQDSKYELQIIDKYTTGLYQDVEYDLAQYLLLRPAQFDLYVLYVKSLIYQKKKFHSIGNHKSIQNQILQDVYNIISATGNPNDAALNLLRIANNLTNVIISYGIIDFVNFKTKGKDERKLFAKLSYNMANPIVHEVLKEKSSQIEYLQFLQKRFPNSITIEFLLSKLVDINSISRFEKLLPEAKFKTEIAKGFQIQNNYIDAAKEWEIIIANYNDTIPILETAIKNLFICYEKLQRFDDCIKLYVNSYFINTFLVTKIEVESILRRISENRFRVVSPLIELPIFYTIANADENELHNTFEKFNFTNKISKPSELLSRFDDFEFNKILFYLKFTCRLDVLRHSTEITGSRERLEERLSIVQFLKDKDLKDKDLYDAEIKYISNILVIQKGLIDLDDGKIYVNEQGILNNELKEYESYFNRFQVIAGLTEKNKSLLFLKKGKLTQLNYSEESVESETIEYSTNPVYDIYIEMFEAIKEKFLYSKDGIVAYLSTRIRHGVLLGEIRPVFEKYKLITKKEGDSLIYKRNNHWEQIYKGESSSNQTIIQTLLQDFSYSIDGLIFDLIKTHLQVYDEKNNKEGWFMYDFDDDVLFWHSIKSLNSIDYAHFVQQVFEILWDRTDENLTIIREKIQTNILLQFNELFDQLESDLINKLGPETSQLIVSAIKACSTETQTVITRISSWFKRSGTSASDFQLENVIDIVMGYTDKNKRINLIKSIECNCIIKGIYLKHFADLLWIFTENILKHADDISTRINSKISTSRANDILEIKIENEITNKLSLDTLKTIWVNKKIDITKLINEGKSGYHKAYKILKYDLLNEDNNLTTDLNEEDNIFGVTLRINLNKLLS